MALFRRRKDSDASDDDGPETAGAAQPDAPDVDAPDVDAPDPDATAGGASGEQPEPSPLSQRPDGPLDASEVDDGDAVDRLDLGGLRLAVPPEVEVRLDLDQQQQIVAATLVHGEELMQLGAFAAPRTEGIWDEVRAEIAESIAAGGGNVTETAGPYGTELVARVPTDTAGVFAPARFVGVDGPRWFLRALYSGPFTARGDADPVLEQALRGVVVVRGPDAMAPRDGLPLRLPKEAVASAQAALAGQADEAAAGEGGAAPPRPALELPERGPEITETR